MAEFIFMLTWHDATVPDALAVYDEIRTLPLRYVGFKDIGQPVDVLRRLTEEMHADGREVMLEVVSETIEDELRSVAAAREIGVDWVLGGTHPDEVLPLLGGSGIRYCPFPGIVTGHPSVLTGTIEGIAESARSLTARPGVHGLDLLAYRYAGDVERLVTAVLAASAGPVIAAGSVDSVARIQGLDRLGVWAFTVGSAIFENQFPAPANVREQVACVLEAAGARAAP
jgi:hypothetical protein